jgi:lipopolysaccharide/colanic/teichoic acid biosynthesis glycosyltransferase
MLVAEKKKNANRKKTQAVHPPEGHIRVSVKVQPSRYFRVKETLDRLAAAILLIPGIPLIGLLILLVRLTSRGPGIYRQARLGKDAKVFHILKIRTMHLDAEKKTGPVWATANDPRITRLGRFFRKLHLDELPQLINVMKNEMSLIGPRPERPEIVAALLVDIPDFTDRLAVLPGVTGLAQINLPPDATTDDARRKMVLDMRYIRNAGPWLDARILMSTFVRMVGMPGDLAMKIFRLECPELHGGVWLVEPKASGNGDASEAADRENNGNTNGTQADGSSRDDHKSAKDSSKPYSEILHKAR